MSNLSPNLCCMLAKLNMQHMALETRQRTALFILQKNECTTAELQAFVDANGTAKAKRNARALIASLERA